MHPKKWMLLIPYFVYENTQNPLNRSSELFQKTAFYENKINICYNIVKTLEGSVSYENI
jgi:hypothetical protein